MPSEVTNPTAAAPKTADLRGPALAVLLIAMFMGQFDFFVVNVAAPSIEQDLHAGAAALELIVGGYAFAYASALITGGRLGDLFGHRRLFVTGMLVFSVASTLCGLAGGTATLVAARLAQGFAAAIMLPQVLATITATLPPARRPWALAWYGVASGLGSIAGQVLGGLLVEADLGGLGWRLIFLINLPIGLVAALLAHRMLPEAGELRAARLDPVGAAGIAATLGLILVPLVLGREQGWPVSVWAAIAAGILMGAATLGWERRLAAEGRAPVLDPALLKVRSLTAGIGANAAFMMYFASLMFTLTLLLQEGLQLTAFRAGLVFAPMGVAFTLSALATRPLVARWGVRAIATGCLVTAAGLAGLSQVAHARPGHTPVWAAVALVVVGLGNGVVLPALIGAALTGVRPAQAGAAAGVLNTTQQFASAAGVAVIGTLYFAVAAGNGHFAAMRWSAVAGAVLVLVVAVLVIALRPAPAAQR
jgi:EmrB/QacA subfamily drug resistance transporter